MKCKDTRRYGYGKGVLLVKKIYTCLTYLSYWLIYLHWSSHASRIVDWLSPVSWVSQYCGGLLSPHDHRLLALISGSINECSFHTAQLTNGAIYWTVSSSKLFENIAFHAAFYELNEVISESAFLFFNTDHLQIKMQLIHEEGVEFHTCPRLLPIHLIPLILNLRRL